MTVSAEKAEHIWEVLRGAIEPENEAQADFIATIKNVYLNSHNPTTPQSYLDKHPIEQEKKYKSRIGEAYA